MFATSCAVPLFTLCAEAKPIFSLSVSIKALYAVVFAWYSITFGHRKIVLQKVYVILAQFAPQGSENCKILGLNPG